MAARGPNQGKGFGGFDSLVSDISNLSVPEPVAASQASDNAAFPPSSIAPSVAGAKSETGSHSASDAIGRPTKPTGNSAGRWVFLILGILGVVWIVSSLTDSKVSTPPSQSIAAPESAIPKNTPTYVPDVPVTRPVTKEQIPPVGTDNVLTEEEIRYCLSQDTRLGAAKLAVNASSQADIDRFNSLVGDYNSRCAQFRYHTGALQSIQAEVDAKKSTLEAEGAALFPFPAPALTPTPPNLQPTAKLPKQPQKSSDSRENRSNEAPSRSALTEPERTSLEAVCSQDKYLNGAAAYQACIAKHLSEMRDAPRRPDLSGLSNSEAVSAESACSQQKYLSGPATYNRCLQQQLAMLGGHSNQPDLSRLTYDEKTSIESACSQAKYLNGPAAYDACLLGQLKKLREAPKPPDMAALSLSTRQRVENACSQAKYLDGPAAYNACLTRQLIPGRTQ